MSKVTVYYWPEYRLGQLSFPHVSLQTPSQYYSFCPHPDSTQESSSSLAEIKSGQYMELSQDMKNGGKPTLKIELPLEITSIESAVKILRSTGDASWLRWNAQAHRDGFNSATAVLLLLKVGGLASRINSRTYQYQDGRYKDRSLEELFKAFRPTNLEEFKLFAQTVNKDINPYEVALLAQVPTLNRSWKGYAAAAGMLGLLVAIWPRSSTTTSTVAKLEF